MPNSKYDQNAHELTFIFSGHLDSAASIPLAPEVEKKVTELAGEPSALKKPLQVIFDLKAVDFISSAFIRICLTVSARVKAGNLTLLNASPLIKKTIKISGLESQLKVL